MIALAVAAYALLQSGSPAQAPASPNGPLEKMRQSGADLSAIYASFAQSFVAGGRDDTWRFGGKLMPKLRLDGGKLGLWPGLFVTLTGEFAHGRNANLLGGTLLPPNTAHRFPKDGAESADLSLTVTQAFSPKVVLTAGKFNMIDNASRTPILGGGGFDTFWNVAFAAPATGVIPAYITGVSLAVNTETAQITAMIYDPRNAQRKVGLKGWGSRGVSGRLGVTFPVKVNGLDGFHNFAFVTSSQTGVDLADIPQLILPPGNSVALGRKQGYYFGSYSVQQYISQVPGRPGAGWGVFGQASVSEGNPNPIAGTLLAGLAGNGVSRQRPLDRFGVAYAKYFLSQDLLRGLESVGINLVAEQVVETYYSFAVTPWFRLIGDLQIIDPGVRSFGRSVFLGVGAQFRF